MKAREFRTLREQGQWTLKSLGTLMGIHWTTIWRYEHAQRGIPVPVALLLRRLVKDLERQRDRDARRAEGARHADL